MGWLGSFFKKLWNAIKKVLTVLLIIAAIVIAVWACLITGGAALPLLFGLSTTMMYVVAGLCLVGAFIVDKDTAKKAVGVVADAVGDAATAVGTVAGAAASGAIAGILDNPYVLMIGIGIAAYFLLSSGSGSAASVGSGARAPATGLPDKKSATRDEKVGDIYSDRVGAGTAGGLAWSS